MKIEVNVKMRSGYVYEVDEEKLREACKKHGVDWETWQAPWPETDAYEDVLYDVLGDKWWEDALKSAELDEIEMYQGDEEG